MEMENRKDVTGKFIDYVYNTIHIYHSYNDPEVVLTYVALTLQKD